MTKRKLPSKLSFPKPDKKTRKGIKITALDSLFSLYIRYRDHWTCQRCQKQFTPPTSVLQCSHYFGRTRHSVRFDPDNCVALCFGCHRFLEKEDREGYRVLTIRKIGITRYNLLCILAEQTAKPDIELLKRGFTVMLDEAKAEYEKNILFHN